MMMMMSASVRVNGVADVGLICLSSFGGLQSIERMLGGGEIGEEEERAEII